MTRLRGPLTATAAVALLLLGACARPADDAAGESAAPPPVEDNTLVLRVRHEGGFMPPERLAGRLPLVSVYADGRILTEGPVQASYPGPALPSVLQRRTGPAEARALAERAVSAGVRPDADLGQPNVADAPTTVIDVATADGPRTVKVVALRESAPDDPMLTAGQRAARAKLAAFVDTLTEPPDTAGQVAYQPVTMLALARAYRQPQDGLPAQPPPIAWPGPALPGADLFPTVDLGCVAVTGSGLAELTPVLRDANQNTPWTSQGALFALTFRPLLPDESGCADLKEAR